MKRTIVLGLLLLVGLAVVETVSRTVLGLGDPPLSIAHPRIEYMCKPSCTCRRFGNAFRTNRYGMRSDELSPAREGDEARILMLGDSIVNGGGLTDQAELASEIVRQRLAAMLHIPVVVGNISAGSWSPDNLLAYIKEYGTFDAEVAVIVLNEGDLDDMPVFAPLDPNTHPTEKPLTATGELLTRYLWPRFVDLLGLRQGEAEPFETPDAGATCLPALDQLIRRLRDDGSDVLVLYHPSRDEITGKGDFLPARSFAAMRNVVVRQGIPFLSLSSRYGAAIKNHDVVFRDENHPNVYGQALMADEILQRFEDQGFVDRWRQRR